MVNPEEGFRYPREVKLVSLSQRGEVTKIYSWMGPAFLAAGSVPISSCLSLFNYLNCAVVRSLPVLYISYDMNREIGGKQRYGVQKYEQ